MSDHFDNIRSDNADHHIEPAVPGYTDMAQTDSDRQALHPPADLFDESSDSETVFPAPEKSAPADAQPVQQPDRSQTRYLMPVIFTLLIAGIGYYLLKADNNASDTTASTATDSQQFQSDSTVLKPLPIPDMGDTETTQPAATPEVQPQPSSVTPSARKSVTAPVQAPVSEIVAATPKPKATTGKKRRAIAKPLQPQTHHAAWAVNLMALSKHDAAQRQIGRLTAKGFHPELEQINTGGRTLYRIRIANLPDKKSAEKLRNRFRAMPEYKQAWINHYNQ